ncbi:MAG: hypothetical protein LH632_03760 [Rhodoferax sp.]|nr:hypothetical protein [Rhodoferax sp.]
MAEPMLRAWMQDWVQPAKRVTDWPGRWVAEAGWPSARIADKAWALNADGLGEAPGVLTERSLCSPQTAGLGAGNQCSYGSGPDLSDDQRADDANSLCFDSAPLAEPIEILGEARIEIEIASDQPQALLAVRLCDVAPDGSSLRISYGLLNLTHRHGPAAPEPLVPGRFERVVIPLCATATHFDTGHRLRIALSNAYWPIAWPSPVANTLTVRCGSARLVLPVRPPQTDDASLPAFGEPEAAAPLALVETRARRTDRPLDRIVTDPDSGCVELLRERDRGAWRTVDTDVDYDTRGELRFSVHPDDPGSAEQDITLTTTMGRTGWRVRTEVHTRIACTAEAFIVKASLRAFEGDEEVFSRSWDESIARDCV